MSKENQNWLHDLFISEAKAAQNYHNRGGEETPTQEKAVDIIANGTVEVTPDDGYVMSKVTANVNVPKDGVDKIQRYIELNNNSASYLFYTFNGTSVDELLDGVDTSNVTSVTYMFRYSKQIEIVPLFDTRNVTSMNYMFETCQKLKTIPLFNTRNVTSMNYMFSGCTVLETIPSLDIRNVTSANNMLSVCFQLTECWLRNIKVNLQANAGKFTFESLLHLCKECRKTTSSITLTVGTENLAKLEGVYVKLIDITDEMRAEDDLIDEKYPFVQCESTDAGAMTIQDYMALKMWTLA